MTSCEKRKFPYSFFIVLTQWHEFPAPKLTNLHIFVIAVSLNVTFLRSPYLNAQIKINYETDYIGTTTTTTTNRDISRTITTAKMELLVALVRSFQLLSNLSNEYYTIFWNSYRWSNEVWLNCRDIQLLSKTDI